jgi:hypothetical protein
LNEASKISVVGCWEGESVAALTHEVVVKNVRVLCVTGILEILEGGTLLFLSSQ